MTAKSKPGILPNSKIVGMTINNGLIKTKYCRPSGNKYHISRERLAQKLDHSLKRKLTTITAPAGYGKTSLVVDWVEKRGLLAAWVSLDSNDNNPIVFWRYACAALDGIAAGIARDTDYVFGVQELIDANIHLSILIERLLEVKTDFLLILDNIHLITHLTVLRGLAYLIGYLPPKMHLILSGREEPRLELAKHGIKSELLRISFKDLCFQTEEILRFYQTRGFTLGNNDLRRVESYTEGWAAALVAIAMSLEEGADGGNTNGNLAFRSQDINQFLKDEVFDYWPEEKQTFVMKTAILDTLCGPLCGAITGSDNGIQLLQEINERNGFLFPLDCENREYAFHPLFKEFLYKLLVESAPDLLPDCHRKAATWYRENGSPSKAIEHLLSGDMYQDAVNLIEEQIDRWGPRKDFITVFSWVARLPEAYQQGSIQITAEYALYYAEMHCFDLSREWIVKLETLAIELKVTSNPELNGYVQTVLWLLKAHLFMKEGEIGKMLSCIHAAAAVNADRYYKMEEYLDLNSADIYFYRCPSHKMVRLFGEDPVGYEKVVVNYRRMIKKNPGYAPLIAGEYLYENNRLDEALPYLLAALEEARTADCPGALVPVMVDIARLRRACGDFQGALDVLDECDRNLQNETRIHWRYTVDAFRCRLSMDCDVPDRVERWFEACKLNIFMEINRVREFELLVYVRVLMAKERWRDAELLLKRLQNFAARTERPHSLVEVYNLLAIVADQKGDPSGTVHYLEKSLGIGNKEGYIRSFLDESEPMAGLLERYLKQQLKCPKNEMTSTLISYAKGLLKQIQESLGANTAAWNEAATVATKKLLTGQERKVLALLLDGDTNQEIGQKLGIGLPTVKSHISNIYSKLEVKNRVQCVKLARETGLYQ